MLAVGAKTRGWSATPVAQYCRRLQHWRTAIIPIKSASGPRALADEARRITQQIPAGATTVALQVGAGAFSTQQFCVKLNRWLLNGPVAFVIGGAEGLEPALIDSADEVLSLSPLTLAHEVAKVVLLEQIYRCATLRSGHPYHR